MALRVYSSKKIGNESRRSRIYTGADILEGGRGINYKINVMRVGAVLFGYLELIAATVLVGQNSSYSIGEGSMIIVGAGLLLHVLTNVTFMAGYCCIVYRNRDEEGSES